MTIIKSVINVIIDSKHISRKRIKKENEDNERKLYEQLKKKYEKS